VRRHGIPPSRSAIEITETVTMDDTCVRHECLKRLRGTGVHVSIDDFGAGHSSLTSVQNLPAAELKADCAFVTDLECSAEARSNANTVMQTTHPLDRRVAVEIVEAAAPRHLLAQLGCDEL
jgi:diguanylate cyclase